MTEGAPPPGGGKALVEDDDGGVPRLRGGGSLLVEDDNGPKRSAGNPAGKGAKRAIASTREERARKTCILQGSRRLRGAVGGGEVPQRGEGAGLPTPSRPEAAWGATEWGTKFPLKAQKNYKIHKFILHVNFEIVQCNYFCNRGSNANQQHRKHF